jgi:diguanylate cyclase (GGDEF)-like protein/PAS domain S-box-containing protein
MSKLPGKTVLLIEENPRDARLVQEMLGSQSSHTIELLHVDCMSEAVRLLAKNAIDVIVIDLELAGAHGLDALRQAHQAALSIPIVVLSGVAGEPLAVQAMHEGAQDYLIKGQIEPRELLRALRNAVERKIFSEIIFEEKERAQVTLDSIGDAVICTDIAGNLTFLNLVAERLTGWAQSEAQGKPMAEVFQIVDPSTRRAIPNPMEAAVSQNRTGHLPVNCILTSRDGSEFFIEDTVAPIHDHEGKVTGSVIVFRDVTEVRALAEKVVHAAEHDFLTGLPNRFLLSDRLGQAIAMARRHGGLVAVLFLDLDGFKHINDSLGHPAGDKLLCSIAKRMSECIRSPDTVSRQGGDEFIALLEELFQPEDAANAARRILRAVAETHLIDGHELHVTASIGVSIYPDDGLDAETLIKNADTAMYQAKESGRQGYKFFEPEMNRRAVDRQSIEEDLRCALRRNEFTLHYQPKIDLKTGAITGAEALLRWAHPTRGSIPPLQFIPIAEDSGMILPIGAWVLREACTQARAWTDAGLPFATIAVNVSAVQFRNENFLKDLFATLSETGMDPRSLELEVTESVLMEHPESTAPILDALRQEGVQVSVDDFGTGYSSLSYLQLFPIDALKIDQSFIRRIASSPGDTTIVSAIIAMGQNLHMRVIAEGVETLEDLTFLKAHSCDEAQGYYFSRPVPAKDFAALLIH